MLTLTDSELVEYVTDRALLRPTEGLSVNTVRALQDLVVRLRAAESEPSVPAPKKYAVFYMSGGNQRKRSVAVKGEFDTAADAQAALDRFQTAVGSESSTVRRMVREIE